MVDKVMEQSTSAYLLSENKEIIIGRYKVQKVENEITYNIYDRFGNVLYDDIHCADSVIAIVECLLKNNRYSLNKILREEHEYKKQYYNVLFMKRAVKQKYSPVYEDRYELAKEKLLDSHNKIKRIRKIISWVDERIGQLPKNL